MPAENRVVPGQPEGGQVNGSTGSRDLVVIGPQEVSLEPRARSGGQGHRTPQSSCPRSAPIDPGPTICQSIATSSGVPSVPGRTTRLSMWVSLWHRVIG